MQFSDRTCSPFFLFFFLSSSRHLGSTTPRSRFAGKSERRTYAESHCGSSYRRSNQVNGTQCAAENSIGGHRALDQTAPRRVCLEGLGYDQGSVWVSDRCAAEFGTGAVVGQDYKPRPLSHVPNVGFLLFTAMRARSIPAFTVGVI